MRTMNFSSVLIGLVVVLTAAPAWAVNKCTGPDGKVVFQDAPCAGRGEKITVRPASGEAPAAAATVGAAPTDAAQRMNQQISQMATERRRRDLEIALPNAYSERASHSAACDQELSALRDKKGLANNNLAGATWQESISQEMNAVAKRCETRNSNISANIDALRKECQALGGCK